MDTPKETWPKLYCGKCGHEASWMGIEPRKLLTFICEKCMEFNDLEWEDTKDGNETVEGV